MNTPEYDLTVLTLFSGRSIFLNPYAEALKALKKPGNVQYLFIDNSRSPVFYQNLAQLGGEIHKYPGFLARETADTMTREAQLKKAEHCAALYAFSQSLVRGKELLILEHDVIPKPDALEKIMESRDRCRADLMSASIVSRTTGEWLGWRFQKNQNSVGRVQITRRPKRVLATGFGFLLMKAEIFQAMKITAVDIRYPFYGSDILAGVWAREQGLRWFMDGGVRCAHMMESGSPASLGRRSNVVAGPLFHLYKIEDIAL